MDKLNLFLNDNCKEISLNYSTIEFATKANFAELQNGYRINPISGESLIGNENGDWKDSWYVIAYNEGDPIFIDNKNNRIYTAFHSEEKWEPLEIAPDIQKFSNIINELRKISKNRENPSLFEKNRISEEEINKFKNTILLNQGNFDYWLIFLEE